LGPQDSLCDDGTLARELCDLLATRASGEEADRRLGSVDRSARSLRRRIAEVQRSGRSRALARLLRLRVLRDFRDRGLTPAPPMAGSAEVSLEPVDLHALATGVYPAEALELVREHVLAVIGRWDHLVRDFPLRLALAQVGQLYGLSLHFGYSLRQAEMRYRLDHLAGAPEAAHRSLKEYMASFSHAEMQLAGSVASQEAEALLDGRMVALFGDLEQLWEDFQMAIAESSFGGASVSEAIQRGEVESIRVTVGGLRQIVLEGTAYGFLLGVAEADVDSAYELTPTPSRLDQ